MADSTNGQASKPSIFGKMFSIIKNVTDMAMDLQTDEGLSDNDDNNAADEDDEPPMLDFLTKYDVGSSIHNDLTADAVTKITDAEVNLLDLSGPTQDLLDPDLLALDTNIGDLLIDDLVVADSTTDPENLTPVDNQEAATDCAADIAQMGGLESSGAARRGFISSGIAQTFHTRVGPNYKANKQKAPSASALLELMSVE